MCIRDSLFGMVFTSIARNSPEAFAPPQSVVDGETTMYYFSFVTLTSLGYGDIAPASDAPRILATLESIIGAILLAALVGRIVGLLVAQETDTLHQPVETARVADDPPHGGPHTRFGPTLEAGDGSLKR